jgi:hypothetical protein
MEESQLNVDQEIKNDIQPLSSSSMQILRLLLHLFALTPQAVRDVADIAGGGASSITKISLIHIPRVVHTQRLVDCRCIVPVAENFKILLIVPSTSIYHPVYLILIYS